MRNARQTAVKHTVLREADITRSLIDRIFKRQATEGKHNRGKQREKMYGLTKSLKVGRVTCTSSDEGIEMRGRS